MAKPIFTRRRVGGWAPSGRSLLVVVAALALVAGGVLLGRSLFGASEAERVAERFVGAWEQKDYAGMHALLTPVSRANVDARPFEGAYERAALTATLTGVEAGEPAEDDGLVTVPVVAATRVFGDVRAEIAFRAGEDGVLWAPSLVFPGLREDEELVRRTRAPRRAALVGEDGETIVTGAAGSRRSPLGASATAAAGTVGPAPTPEEREQLYERGFPRSTAVGLTGLERVFERELAGTPGGTLRAGERTLAETEPTPAEPVRTTIDVDLHSAALSALGGRGGGIAALDARTGEVRALAGLALSGPQPPGSTFKIVTTTAALEADLVQPSERFPVETAATITGVKIRNAHGEACGGTFTVSFAKSCNSVFAPLGVEVGDERLVDAAERYGFNVEPAIPSVDRSTIPSPREIESDLALGATAIGQGQVLATPLEMASISQTVAAGGERMPPRLAATAPEPTAERVTSGKVAGTITDLMGEVVRSGTGDRAAIAGVEVAGKTGTAELGNGEKDHAWFTAFAPLRRPKLAVGVLIANGGAGGEVAAPVAKSVLEAGVGR